MARGLQVAGLRGLSQLFVLFCNQVLASLSSSQSVQKYRKKRLFFFFPKESSGTNSLPLPISLPTPAVWARSILAAAVRRSQASCNRCCSHL